jgi:hypothetical protein
MSEAVGCAHCRAALSGEAPPSPVAEAHLTGCVDCQAYEAELGAIEQLFRELAPPAPPAPLVESLRAKVEAELRAAPRPESRVVVRRWWVAAGGVAAAAVLATVVWPTHEAPPVLIERGVGGGRPELGLKVAVRGPEGGVERLSRDAEYHPGDTLYFRATLDRGTWVGLLRVDSRSTDLVHEATVAAGESDLVRGEGPLAWRIEPGEESAVFLLVAGDEPWRESVLDGALPVGPDGARPLDPIVLCGALDALGVQCAAVRVRVSP